MCDYFKRQVTASDPKNLSRHPPPPHDAAARLPLSHKVHAYERNRPDRPGNGYLEGPDEVTGDDVVAAMDAVGVDGALLISPFSLYRYDASCIH